MEGGQAPQGPAPFHPHPRNPTLRPLQEVPRSPDSEGIMPVPLVYPKHSICASFRPLSRCLHRRDGPGGWATSTLFPSIPRIQHRTWYVDNWLICIQDFHSGKGICDFSEEKTGWSCLVTSKIQIRQIWARSI